MIFNYHQGIMVFQLTFFIKAVWLSRYLMKSYFMADEVLFPEVFIISLDRTPERYEFVSQQLNALDIPHHRFPAVDGYNVTLTDIYTGISFKGADLATGKVAIEKGSVYWVECLEKPQDFVSQPELGFFKFGTMAVDISAGELGVSCSNRYIWQYLYTNNIPYALILEDDVTLNSDFKKQLINILSETKKLDMLYLCVQDKRVNDFGQSVSENLVKLDNSLELTGTYAYIISTQAAQAFTNFSNQQFYPVDNYIAHIFGSSDLAIFNVKNKLCEVDVNGSVINTMGRIPR